MEHAFKRGITALAGLILLLGLWFSPAAKAAAKPHCQAMAGHQVCLESIRRSAKYTWEYRAGVRVDNETRPVQRYDCRQRPAKLEAEAVAQLNESAIRQFVCSLVAR
ncbi:MAG: hypothetical protein HC922_11490 [Leptolyngbyaceae cyanobacterium SM2_3_12]|nr:hypothetical protein [Leptolyngbyaceae cyanobacterium SM2_3_12]